MKKYKVKIKGLAPLLQAKHPTPQEEEEILKRAKSAKKTKDLTDDEAFEMHSYKNKDGKFFQPSEMIEASMAKAGVQFKLEGKKTYKDLMKSGIIIEPAEIVHINQVFEQDARWAKNPTTRGAIWVVRPVVNEWELNFTIHLLQDERVDPAILKEILIYAGLYIGIGAWRPKFGRFEIIEFNLVK